VHAPLTHAEALHAVPVFHWPFDWHVCSVLPEHCRAPGVHVPVQTPDTHAALHATVVPHWPLLPHVCTPLPLHCTAPGAHTPVHAPATHAWPLHATGEP
jgi:hypothetical protein